MRNASLRRLTVGTVAAGLLLTGCGTTAEGGSASGGGTEEGPVSGLRVLVPNSPGSGYDTTARAWAQVAEEEGLAETIEVFNLEGAGGTVGLQRVVNEAGNADLLMQMGLGVVGAQYSNQSEATLDQTTPIARLIEEAEAIVVPADSPFQTLDDLIAAWQADPGNTPVGGASNPGGPDHLTPMLLAQEVGVTPTAVNYVAYDGGGELLAGILGGDVAFAATGIGEVTEPAASGDVRILAVTSEQPVEGVDAPTIVESGLDVTLSNWRGVVAPADISDEDRASLLSTIDKMVNSEEWAAELENNGWDSLYQSGDAFAAFLDEQVAQSEQVLTEIGLV
jgi:putative tricarboxylic transport membrane protein